MSLQPQFTTSTTSTSSTDELHGSLIRRSWHAMSELLSPFSSSALAQLPKRPARPSRYTRANEIPDVEPTDEDGQMPTVRDYHSITVPPQVRVPKKTPTPVRVESKVWFANERSPYIFSLLLLFFPLLWFFFGFVAVAVKALTDPLALDFSFSVGVVSQYVRLDRHARRGAFQCVQRSYRAQFCVRIRRH